MKTTVTKAKNVNSSDEELKKKAFEELKNTIQKVNIAAWKKF